MAGVLHVDWRPFTWNELHHMYMGAQRAQWEQTSSLMTLLVNVNTDKKENQLDDFNTFNIYRLDEGTEDPLELLRRAEAGEVKTNFSLKDLKI